MDIKQDLRILLRSHSEGERRLAQMLADRLGLPPPMPEIGQARLYFAYSDDRLELYTTQLPGAKPLYVDFLSGPSYYRFVQDRRINHPLARAVGIKRGVRPSILDATAGFGEDSFVLAGLGCQVLALERSPVIWALLDDAIRRAHQHHRVGPLLRHHFTLHLTDSIEFIKQGRGDFETIYLDPMYPARRGSALNKQKMRLLKSIVGPDQDGAELLDSARLAARRRVVVKRPAQAPYLGGVTPALSLNGKRCRFDIYLETHL